MCPRKNGKSRVQGLYAAALLHLLHPHPRRPGCLHHLHPLNHPGSRQALAGVAPRRSAALELPFLYAAPAKRLRRRALPEKALGLAQGGLGARVGAGRVSRGFSAAFGVLGLRAVFVRWSAAGVPLASVPWQRLVGWGVGPGQPPSPRRASVSVVVSVCRRPPRASAVGVPARVGGGGRVGGVVVARVVSRRVARVLASVAGAGPSSPALGSLFSQNRQ